MDWQTYIHSDPDILLGQPVVKGTRLSVEFLLSLLASGWTEQHILDNYPTLMPETLRAVFASARNHDTHQTQAATHTSAGTGDPRGR